MSRFAKIKVALQGIPDLQDPINRLHAQDAAIADLQWTVGEIERLQKRVTELEGKLERIGHKAMETPEYRNV